MNFFSFYFSEIRLRYWHTHFTILLFKVGAYFFIPTFYYYSIFFNPLLSIYNEEEESKESDDGFETFLEIIFFNKNHENRKEFLQFFFNTHSFSFYSYNKNKEVLELFYSTNSEIDGVTAIINLFFGFNWLFPYLFYHIWSYTCPCFYAVKKKKINFILTVSFFFFLGCNITLSDFIIADGLLSLFRLEKSGDNFKIINDYQVVSFMGLAGNIYLVFHFLFQIPTFFLYLLYLNKITPFSLSKNRKFFIYFFIIIQFVFLPKYSQMFYVFFLLQSLYEITLFFGFLFKRKKRLLRTSKHPKYTLNTP